MTTKWVLGTELCATDQRRVLASYINRFTIEHRPAWVARTPNRPDGKAYMPQFASDQDWLAHTEFRIRNDGRLDERANFCHSTPTWPLGIEPKETV